MKRIGAALFAFLLLPGIVAFYLPWQMRPRTGRFHTIGLLPVAVGTVLLVWCARDFYVRGRGSLAPWAPPKELVIAGLYRYSRNPMYIAVFVILCGWVLVYDSASLRVYALLVACLFHLRVVLGEEPWLARTYGEQWRAYRLRVPRWLFTLHAPGDVAPRAPE